MGGWDEWEIRTDRGMSNYRRANVQKIKKNITVMFFLSSYLNLNIY